MVLTQFLIALQKKGQLSESNTFNGFFEEEIELVQNEFE